MDCSPTQTRTFAEFFAGIGLVRLALERQGWTALFANDNDPHKARMYRANFAGEELSTADVNDLGGGDVPSCDLFTASFPCNDLSVAGAKAGLNGKQSGALFPFLRIVREKGADGPSLILLENVLGLLGSRGGRDLEAALLALNELGYVVDLLALNAARFTPQSRPRLFIVAKRHPLHSPHLPAECELRPTAVARFIAAHRHIAWDLRPLPAPPAPNHRLEEILEKLDDDDPLWWNESRAAYFLGQLSERHRAAADAMIAGEFLSYATAFRRVRHGRSMAELRTDGLAGCLRTPRGGSGRQILFQAGRGGYRVRLLSPRECARLQGAPDSFRIEAPLNQALFGFGDAVCVPAVEWIARHYLSPALEAMSATARPLSAGSV